MPECEFKKVALHVFKTPFHKKISGGLLLLIISSLRLSLSLSLSCHILYIFIVLAVILTNFNVLDMNM